MLPLDLAPLSDVEQAHEARVRAHIAAAIDAAGGWLGFDQFMALALYAPGLGYYAAGAHKLGAGGDFVTVPELSPVFGRCLGTECRGVLSSLGGGGVLEIGAGTGALAEEILQTLAESGCLPEQYWILETSPDLRERQRVRLGRLPAHIRSRVVWLDRPPEMAFQGVVLANEVIDALPVVRVCGDAAGIAEMGVVEDAGQFRASPRPASSALKSLMVQRGIHLAPGQQAEVCPTLEGWLAEVTRCLSRGVALFIDYGDARTRLYTPERAHGTLAAFHRHRIHQDPFIHLGLQDITAWVDFTAVAEAGLAAGLEVAGYTTQGCYLLGCGFENHLADLRARLPADREPLAARAALRLVLPHDMGERFKCVALTRDYDDDLLGFQIRDFTDHL
jgi:SAM-dependent MidA family methyltransferase